MLQRAAVDQTPLSMPPGLDEKTGKRAARPLLRIHRQASRMLENIEAQDGLESRHENPGAWSDNLSSSVCRDPIRSQPGKYAGTPLHAEKGAANRAAPDGAGAPSPWPVCSTGMAAGRIFAACWAVTKDKGPGRAHACAYRQTIRPGRFGNKLCTALKCTPNPEHAALHSLDQDGSNTPGQIRAVKASHMTNG
eukprot:CAMPEP_0177587928 /NCGR_PEP_ID=MMETSP0419_2-20121207/5934_1 /TAXON_ID=582737 /ORGANISM="Tetraselmis sp., Strain GSL018" /LENGTH=192 /DNA_ID=CAMNT_0019078053 /DNA_START=494 /DNA_END=1074 /DNA_ORIENTATION=+